MSSKSPGPKRKQYLIKLLMLDDQEIPFQIESKTTGFELTTLIYQFLKLIESDYFGLEYVDSKGKKCWLDYDKAVMKQLQGSMKLIFCVKFYTPDPGQLEEEYTRYLYALQIKRDLAEGVLLCSDATAALLASYILQETYNTGTNFFQNKRFFPHQTEEHEIKILDYYKNHTGQSPADADLNLLDIARKVELYGIFMHPAKDHEGVQLNLAVAHMGILVFQNYTKINTFSWAKIRKLSFKRKKFLVKLHPENFGFYKDTVEFYFDNRDDSKNFWKKCIEHHSFFRCISTQRMPRQRSKLLTRGSSFRYYGRTQKELIETARENFGKNRSFDRSYHSMRSISQFGGGGGIGGCGPGQINGTQSLNRNLASRSAGAIIMPANVSSTLSSNDSSQHFHTYNQNASSSAHHLAYIPSQKSATLQTQNNMEKMAAIRGLAEQNNEPDSVSSLNYNTQQSSYSNQVTQPLRDNDSSTHGSRTIDSRYSRDKTLGLSDDDADENEDEDDEEEKSQPEEAKIVTETRCSCGQQHDTDQTQQLAENNNLYGILQATSQIPIVKNKPVEVEQLGTSSSSSFKNSAVKSALVSQPSKSSPNQVTLPIQLQKPRLKKTDPITSNAPTTETDSFAIVNPNKIYSRKEVITTYKEETKNTHLEEFHQTTTFYDAAPTTATSSLAIQQPLANASSSSFKSPHYHEIGKLASASPTSTAASTQVQPSSSLTQPQPSTIHQNLSNNSPKQQKTDTSHDLNNENDENDLNDDEGKKINFYTKMNKAYDENCPNYPDLSTKRLALAERFEIKSPTSLSNFYYPLVPNTSPNEPEIEKFSKKNRHHHHHHHRKHQNCHKTKNKLPQKDPNISKSSNDSKKTRYENSKKRNEPEAKTKRLTKTPVLVTSNIKSFDKELNVLSMASPNDSSNETRPVLNRDELKISSPSAEAPFSFSLSSSISNSSLSFLKELRSSNLFLSSSSDDLSFLTSTSSSSSSLSLSSIHKITASLSQKSNLKSEEERLIYTDQNHKSRALNKKTPKESIKICSIEYNKRENRIEKKVFQINNTKVEILDKPESRLISCKTELVDKKSNPISSKQIRSDCSHKSQRKFKSLPRMTKFIEFVDFKRLPACDSYSYQDDTINLDAQDDQNTATFNSTSLNDFRMIVNKFDLNTNIFTCGSTPIRKRKDLKKPVEAVKEEDTVSSSDLSSHKQLSVRERIEEYEKKLEENLDSNLTTRILKLSCDNTPVDDAPVFNPDNSIAADLLLKSPDSDSIIDFIDKEDSVEKKSIDLNEIGTPYNSILKCKEKAKISSSLGDDDSLNSSDNSSVLIADKVSVQTEEAKSEEKNNQDFEQELAELNSNQTQIKDLQSEFSFDI